MNKLVHESIRNNQEPIHAPDTSWLEQGKRVATVALPFIGLSKRWGVPLSIGLGVVRTTSSLSQLCFAETKEIPYLLLQTAISVASLGGTIFAHPIGVALITAHDLTTELLQLYTHLKNKDYDKAAESFASILNNSLYLAFLAFGGLKLAIASMALQILIGVLYTAREEFNQGHYVEASGHVLMALIRSQQLTEQLQAYVETQPSVPSEDSTNAHIATEETPQAAGNESETIATEPVPLETKAASPSDELSSQPLKKITQEEWLAFVKKFPSNFSESFYYHQYHRVYLDLSAALFEAGYSNEIEGISFHNLIKNCDFKGLNFKNCDFSKSTIGNCMFDGITFDHCNFTSSIWVDFICQNSRFIDCSFVLANLNINAWSSLYLYPKFDVKKDLLKETKNQFNNIEFLNCNLSESKWVYVVINQIKANTCSWANAQINKSYIKNSSFDQCNFSASLILKTVLEKVTLSNVDLTESYFFLSFADHLKIQQGQLYASIFLQTSVTDSQLMNCDLRDAMLLDAKQGFSIVGGIPHQITKPIVAIGRDFDSRGSYERLISKELRENTVLVLPYSNNLFNLSSSDLLLSEMKDRYKKISNEQLSIAEQLLLDAEPGSQMDHLKKTAAEILKYADGLIVPGGRDIEPSLYTLDGSGEFTVRSLLEIALLSEAKERKIPTMGICRGSQMINVFLGGTLIQHVDGQFDITQKLEWTDSSIGKELREKLGDGFRGKSNHHQAADRLGQGLHVILKHDNIPKLLLSEDGNFIACQIHPEHYILKRKKLQKSLGDKSIEEIVSNPPGVVDKLFKIEIVYKIYKNFIKPEFLTQAALKRKANLIYTNKKIYDFFFEKVKKFRSLKT